MSAYRTLDRNEFIEQRRASSDRRSPSIASTQKFDDGIPHPGEVSPVKNRYKFSQMSDEQQKQTLLHMANHPSVTQVRRSSGATNSKHPSLEEVQFKLRQMDEERRLEARRRLQASEQRQQRALFQRHVVAEENANAARHNPSNNFEEYIGTMQRVERRALPVDVSTLTSSKVAYRSSRSSSPQARPFAGHDPLLPAGKRINPNDVYYKAVQGKLQGMINNRNNSQDVDSYSRFHPTAATAAAGGRHDGIVPVVSAHFAAQPSSRYGRSASASSARVNVSSIDEYTREVEAAQLRRLKGQAAILEAHQRGDHRPLHYDPLMKVQPVEWRTKDTSVLHGTIPRATILKMQSTEQLLRNREAKSRVVGARAQHGIIGKAKLSLSKVSKGLRVVGDPRLQPDPTPLSPQSPRSGTFHQYNSFGVNTVGVFTAHPTGFEDLPSRRKKPSASSSPNVSVASPSPSRNTNSSPRYVLPSVASADLPLEHQNGPQYVVETHPGDKGFAIRERRTEVTEIGPDTTATAAVQDHPADNLVQQLLNQQAQQQAQIERLLQVQEAYVKQQAVNGVHFKPVTATVAETNPSPAMRYTYYRPSQGEVKQHPTQMLPVQSVQNKYISPSRSLTLNDVSDQSPYTTRTEKADEIRRASVSPDALAPQRREQTRSPPNPGTIAAAFAFASAQTPLVGGSPHDVMDLALNDALSPMSDEASPANLHQSTRPSPDVVRAASADTRITSTNSVGAIAQLFRSGGAAAVVEAYNKTDVAHEHSPPLEAQSKNVPLPQSNVIRNDLFRPSVSRERTVDNGIATFSFREAFDKGEPLPHERAPSVAPPQQVEYYTDTGSPPQPHDPAAMFLLQMAGRRAQAL